MKVWEKQQAALGMGLEQYILATGVRGLALDAARRQYMMETDYRKQKQKRKQTNTQ